MSTTDLKSRLQLPDALAAQLYAFRRRVWAIKALEACGGAIFGVAVGYLAVYFLDRVIDTPTSTRLAIFFAALFGCAVAPLYLHKWIWRQQTLDQLARLIGRSHPSIGDQMLGIIELVRSDFEQHRSLALCQAAISQVARDVSQRDFRDAVPAPRHRLWISAALVPLAVALALLVIYPAAAANAWSRFIAPWRPTPRYTFTTIEELPDEIFVPHGEAVALGVHLHDDSCWEPSQGVLQFGSGQTPVTAALRDRAYEFALPPQIAASDMHLTIGDVRKTLRLAPTLRPELTSIVATVQLPEYLERTKPLKKDARSGSLSLLKGSSATFQVQANRDILVATIDEQPAKIEGPVVTSGVQPVNASRKLVFAWQDRHGLSGQAPFTLTINAREDEAPSLTSEGLPRQRVVLDSEALSFTVHVQDDFGIKRAGLEWRVAGESSRGEKILGERLLAIGGGDRDRLELTGSFCAQQLDISPRSIAVRLFVEDYFPDRGRVYSPDYVLHILDAEQHAIWLTEQMSKWHRQSLEVRDRELQLHHANQQLRLLSPEELDRPETRRLIDGQSAAERANGRRLAGLTTTGEELIRQAMRNPEFGVGHLEKWAEMLKILKDIASQRMPNVADLLKQSSQSPGSTASATKSAPGAGQIRSAGASGSSKPGAVAPPRTPVPHLVDRESSQQPAPQEAPPEEERKSNPSAPRLTLPTTTVASPSAKPSPPNPAGKKLDDAVAAQQDLLTEFEKIAEELNQLLANLEGSTLVKRLKAASRKQYAIGGKIGEQVDGGGFGQKTRSARDSRAALTELAAQEAASSQDLSNIMDDIEAYFERRRYQRFKVVLDEMRKEDAVGSLRQLGDDLAKEAGFSLAQCEFWSDTFDRWADNLLDPACNGKCPGSKSKASLPPSIVLEALQILEAEVNLREETRMLEQVRRGPDFEAYSTGAAEASRTQGGLSERISKLAVRIRELPDGEQEFAYEIALLGKVTEVMDEAKAILARPETGRDAIAAETEAIELLLKSKRINPRGGGGGGSSPGGGGGNGNTLDAALALFGAGLNEKEVREEHDVGQATGVAGAALPEEFRAGLDQYFNRLESGVREP